MSKTVYITTTLPYVNADPHLGFALELVQADVVVRAARLAGREVFFNTGTDEHGLKIYRAAAAAGLTSQAYADRGAVKFRALLSALDVSPEVNFIRTTDPGHIAAAQEFWRRAAAAGDIYKKNYQLKYCVGCELEKTESELTAGHCPLHSNQELEIIEEENYFFRFSKYQKPLLELYAAQPDFVVPGSRLNEVREFVARGLADFSISRLASKQPWGISVPEDPLQTTYVWFDALVNYVSAIGWPDNEQNFKKWWPVIQFAGKDNLRQQAAMWPAMLMSVGLPPPRQIIVHGFVTSGGQKMSKSLGNVIDPFALINDYGADAVRYYLLRHITPFEDSDFTIEKFKETYNANLANGLGNLVSRVMKMAHTHQVRIKGNYRPLIAQPDLEKFEFNKASDRIWKLIADCDTLIQIKKPFSLIKTDPAQAKIDIGSLLIYLADIASLLQPLMSKTSAAITDLIRTNRPPTQPLFPRKN